MYSGSCSSIKSNHTLDGVNFDDYGGNGENTDEEDEDEDEEENTTEVEEENSVERATGFIFHSLMNSVFRI